MEKEQDWSYRPYIPGSEYYSPERPSEIRAGIPAAVGLIGVPDSDLHLVLLSVSEKCAGVRSQTVFICTQWVSVRLYLLRYAEELGKSK